ncbi:similar to Saccharomyces cerevisiae YJL006C CTK2 Beta subunit of C-terminal domain kinase I (CTDK-I) [Maudiozyma barnettii]|uniref:Similar to Saccharomyces cerevisiae YJL006C CTK2 Beta subunit of C-terminal domain kinase I (CTDK-I) n=1 Tax=Maudiozyma barnettii TaxID=61262 RepID=A0A8H2ZFN4_9SACH|nr:Ctk2p [Kazachstania barnettii]CAB4252535.1 similar to Saccharomyces cerevisiae YJL006C CTK2 Beta subunit of C-terminal domain kinase I (CTDK-I) [Kazachstania barnettii]CAD1779271.1 similar to Saccharomyces cerevisiae YJL006C CTK2 Beta subunit of C-terminal domain kinase I (CTDK-I) [Kazachstania barnettii]
MSSAFEAELILSRPYLTRKQISRAQKNTISDLRSYSQKKLVIIKYLSDMCVQLKLPRKTLETAIYYYERYHLFNAFETELIYLLATSCLVLSCKQTETLKKVNEICQVSYKVRKILKANQDMMETFKKRIWQTELRILESCSFDYRVNNFLHIDEYIIKIGKSLQLEPNVCYLAWLIAYDVLKSDILLIVPQHCIAIAILKISVELFNLQNDNSANENNNTKWSKVDYSFFETNESSVNEAYFEISNFYINTFDICDLQANIPPNYPHIGIESFIELKQNTGRQRGLGELENEDINRDPFLNNIRSTAVRERRHVLSSKLVIDEYNAINDTQHK